jgi:hypothetical protein
MKKMNYHTILFLSGFTILTSSQAVGQDFSNARSLSMAGSNIAISEGNEYIGGNPAVLAHKKDFNFELMLFSAHGMVNNNSFSLVEYDRYFTTGDSLTSKDINDIFSKIPEKGWRGNFNLGARALAIYSRPFSLSLGGVGNGFLNFPKDALAFPFYGNAVVQQYDLDDMDSEAWAAASLDFAIAFPITQWTPAEFDFVSVGITAKYLVGILYENVEESSGKLITTDEFILADAHIQNRHSEGGSGYGFDVGIFGIYEKNWSLSLHFSNLFGELYWSRNNELKILSYQSDSLFNLSGIEDLTELDEDTTIAIGRFRTGLPRKAIIAGAYHYLPNLTFTASYQQGLNKTFGNSIVPQVSMGIEYLPVPVLPLRAGVAVGGNMGFALGLGFGIDLKYWQLNLGYMNHDFRWFRSARSIDFAVTTQLRF